MTLEKLAKKLDFNEGYEYYDYCINSFLNGQYSQCEELFSDMDKVDQKCFIRYINDYSLLPADKRNLNNFYTNLF